MYWEDLSWFVGTALSIGCIVMRINEEYLVNDLNDMTYEGSESIVVSAQDMATFYLYLLTQNEQTNK